MPKKPTAVAAPAPSPEPAGVRLLTVLEVAARLGVAKRTVASFIAAGRLPSIKIGGARRIRSDALEAVLAKGLR